MRARLFACAMLLVVFGPASAAAPTYDPAPWLADLDQVHAVFATQDANLEWAVFEREADLPALFADTRQRIRSASDDGDARAAFDRFIRRLGDGHVELHWPSHAATPAAANDTAPNPCGHYDARRAARLLAARAEGYVALQTPQSAVFPAGIIMVGAHRVGVLKIAAFDPYATPDYCRAALTALAIAPDKPCDDACEDRIGDWTGARLNADFVAQLQALKRAKIDTLLVDVADNGGGTEWVQAAMRMVTSVRLVAEQQHFVRGAHWTKKLGELEASLRAAAAAASGADRALLLKLADAAAAKKAVAATPCDSAPLWAGRHPACSWLGEEFYATGPLASADPATLRGKPWAASVFNPMEFSYAEGVWDGPLIVLVDSGSASAAEEFAGELQANHAALIMGEPTSGAVGGHTDGGTPTTLTHSGGVLVVPDLGPDPEGGAGSGGVVPDLLVGFRTYDGMGPRAKAFRAKLAKAVARANASGAAP